MSNRIYPSVCGEPDEPSRLPVFQRQTEEVWPEGWNKSPTTTTLTMEDIQRAFPTPVNDRGAPPRFDKAPRLPTLEDVRKASGGEPNVDRTLSLDPTAPARIGLAQIIKKP